MRKWVKYVKLFINQPSHYNRSLAPTTAVTLSHSLILVTIEVFLDIPKVQTNEIFEFYVYPLYVLRLHTIIYKKSRICKIMFVFLELGKEDFLIKG